MQREGGNRGVKEGTCLGEVVFILGRCSSSGMSLLSHAAADHLHTDTDMIRREITERGFWIFFSE